MRALLILSLSLLISACSKSQEKLKRLDTASINEPPLSVNIEITGYKPGSGMTFEHLFVSNLSVEARYGILTLSSSRDGLNDELKQELAPKYGFSTSGPETTVRGFSDLLLYLTGIDLSQQVYLYCSENQMSNTARDGISYSNDRYISGGTPQFLGLRDCEKDYLDLNRHSFDFDGDGIPDYLELRCGLNPKNSFDALASTAGDGVSNIDKCKFNIPIDETAQSRANELIAYKYDYALNPDNSQTFLISNIPVLHRDQENLIVFYIVEKSLSGGEDQLSTAYLRIPAGSSIEQIIEFEYWGLESEFRHNQEIVLQ